MRRVLLCLLLLTACSDAAPREVLSQGVRLDVRTVGDGDDVLVLVHGGPGLSKEAMAPYEQLASDDLRVVSYDQRGAGRSGAPGDGEYGLDAQVADLEAVRAATGADRIAVLGQSWGGLVAMAYAAAHPDRVMALVLIGSAPADLGEFQRGQAAFAQRLRALQTAGQVPDPLPAAQDGSCAALDAVLPVYAVDAARLPAEPAGVTCTPSTTTATYEDALDAPRLAQVVRDLRSFDAPAVVLAGQQDVFGWLDAVVADVPGAQRVSVPGAGHLVVLEQPQAVLSAARRVLEEALVTDGAPTALQARGVRPAGAGLAAWAGSRRPPEPARAGS